MIIAIDYHSAYGMAQGNRTYITNLVYHLSKIDKQNEYVLYAPSKMDAPLNLPPNFRFRCELSLNPIRRLGFEIPHLIRNDNVDIFHSIYNCPVWKRCKYVVTIHDILFEHYPEFFERLFTIRSKISIRQSVRRADAIITISKYSRDDICATYGIEKSKVYVTSLGVNTTFLSTKDPEQIHRVCLKYGIKDKYILFIGRLEPRKNIPALIKAYSLLLKDGLDEYTLVIGGAKDFGFNEVFRTAELLNMRENIVFPGAISQDDLPSLMSGAKLFAYPAMYEGFGLPVLEAMACGTPVVTSNSSSLSEIVGDAGVLVNPFDIESIVLGIRTLLTNDVLYNDLRQRGLQRAKMFSWQQCAEKTLEVYLKLN